jgi:hypothetical protein
VTEQVEHVRLDRTFFAQRIPSPRPWAALLAVLLLVLGGLGAPSVGAQSTALKSHALIRIEGDSDLCDPAETVNGEDKDGIVNCLTADGSAQAPYRIAGWKIVKTDPGCPLVGACTPAPACSASTTSGAIAICSTSKHIVVEHVDVQNFEGVRGFDDDRLNSVAAAAIVLAGASNVALRWINASAAGYALLAQEGRNAGEEISASNLLLEDVSFSSLLDDATGPSITSLDQPLVLIQDADVTLRRARIDGTGRQTSVKTTLESDNNERPLHRLALADSEIFGASTAGVDVYGYDTQITGNRFHSDGVPGREAAVLTAPDVRLSQGDHVVTHNSFNVINTGLAIERVTGRVQFNKFTRAPQTTSGAAAVLQPQNACSHVRISYNDLNDLMVRNDETECPLPVPFNYWSTGAASGEGEVNRDPVLRLPIDDLPAIDIVAPQPSSGVHGKFLLRGNATPRKGGDLVRIEATDTEEAWGHNVTAEGLAAWILTWDASSAPLGPLSLWVRACSAAHCGVPAELGLVVVERPLPPIALLEARPRVARPGEIVILDGSGSYSPQSRPIAAYRFEIGNDMKTDWLSTPFYEIRYSEVGEYPATLEVIDESGLQNNNLPQIVVRVREEPKEQGNGDPIPSANAPLLLFAAAMALFIIRRRAA